MTSVQTKIRMLVVEGMQLPEGTFLLDSRIARNIPVQLEPEGPITMMLESELQRRVGLHEDDNELAIWVEYRLDDKVVHRSAHVHLKKPTVLAEGAAASLI